MEEKHYILIIKNIIRELANLGELKYEKEQVEELNKIIGPIIKDELGFMPEDKIIDVLLKKLIKEGYLEVKNDKDKPEIQNIKLTNLGFAYGCQAGYITTLGIFTFVQNIHTSLMSLIVEKARDNTEALEVTTDLNKDIVERMISFREDMKEQEAKIKEDNDNVTKHMESFKKDIEEQKAKMKEDNDKITKDMESFKKDIDDHDKKINSFNTNILTIMGVLISAFSIIGLNIGGIKFIVGDKEVLQYWKLIGGIIAINISVVVSLYFLFYLINKVISPLTTNKKENVVTKKGFNIFSGWIVFVVFVLFIGGVAGCFWLRSKGL